MVGRDPGEHERASTPLELLYDLTIVVAFSVSGSNFAHAVAEGHIGSGIVAFLFSAFAVVWAWVGFTWFASAYDTDDWLMRALTLLQMVGVVVLSLGLADVYHGFESWHLDNRIMVAGYVLMRISMIALWTRAARNDPEHAPTLMSLVRIIGLAQIGWIVTGFVHLPAGVLWPLVGLLYVLEIGGYVYSEHRAGTPWHPGHIAERYSLLVIISLGEIVLGTTVAVEAVVGEVGWSVQAVVIVAAGVSLAFGIWWAYFALPWAEALRLRPSASFLFGYGHLPLYPAIAAIGAGLHVAAYYIDEVTDVRETVVMEVMAVPVLVFILVLFGLARLMLPGRDRFHAVLLAVSVALSAASVLMAHLGVPLGWCIVVLMLTPWVTVVGYETRGHHHVSQVVERIRQEAEGTSPGSASATRD